jgi:ribosomal protein L7/L12
MDLDYNALRETISQFKVNQGDMAYEDNQMLADILDRVWARQQQVESQQKISTGLLDCQYLIAQIIRRYHSREKIGCIKEVRECTGWSLQLAKNYVDDLWTVLRSDGF